jgi:adenylate cyclase
MTSPKRFSVSIGAGLLAGVIALVGVTAALVHVPWSVTARAGIRDLAMRLNEQLIDNARIKMSALLDDTVSTEGAIAANLQSGAIGLEHAKDSREALLLSFVQNHPTISAIEIGWPDDRALAVRRLDDGAIVAEETRPSPKLGPALRYTAQYEPGGAGVLARGPAKETRVDYAVSSQFWFKQAFNGEGASWSDIYPNPSNGHLAFARVEAVSPPNGQPAVVAVTMELNRISNFLGSIKHDSGGSVFLTNSFGELVAAADELQTAPDEMPAGMKLSEARSPLVSVAARALQADAVSLAALKDTRQIAYESRERAERYFVTVSPLTQMGLIVGLVVPESAILGDIQRNTERLAYLLIAFIGITALLVSLAAAFTLGRPLAQVTRNTRLLGDFRFDEIKPVTSRLTEIGALSQSIAQMSASLASFRKYVPTEVVRMLFAEGMEAELGGSRRELSILFMDLAHFTQISEALGDDLIPFLGEFLSEMSDEIREGGGTIDKYIGDAIMAFWGAPTRNAAHAISACRAALKCQGRLKTLRSRLAGPRGFELRARIGINTGRVLVGNVGSRDRLNYTAIGDPVNVASRLEPLNKRYDSEILIGEATYLQAKDHIVARRLDRVAVYGKEEGVQVYELLALAAGAAPEMQHWVATYEHGMDALRRREWNAAETLFNQVIALRGGEDAPSRLMLEHVRSFRDTPPPDDWDGVLKLSEK